MDKALFERLTHSMAQMNEIIEGTRQPSRTFEVDAMKIKEIRRASGLSHSKFAALISVSVDPFRKLGAGATFSTITGHSKTPEQAALCRFHRSSECWCFLYGITMPLTVKCLQHMLRIIGNRSQQSLCRPGR